MYPTEEDRVTTPALRLRVLGEFLLLIDNAPVALPNSGRLQALLAYLLLHRAAPQPRTHLAFLLWPDSPEAQALTNLRKLLHQVGQSVPALEACLLSTRQHLQWCSNVTCVADLAEFEAALARATGVPDLASKQAALEAAVAAYRGDLLPRCYDEWILPERERLRQSFTHALDRLIGLLESVRDYPAAIRYAERLLQQDPLHEATYRRLMALHRANGDPAGALRVYQSCAATLQRELGVDPGPAMQALYDELLRATTLPAASARHPLHNLPAPPNRFIGRHAEVIAATALLRQPATRLVSFVGAGGSGKTRLALEVASGLLSAFPEGVWFVDLAPIRDATLVLPAIVRSLQLPDVPGQALLTRLQEYLRDRQTLLLLDNFEQVAPAAPQIAHLLAGAEQLKVLVTSRTALHLYGEQEFPVRPLALPDLGNLPPLDELATQEAVALFLERARAVRPSLPAPPATLRTVAEICRRLDGLPLAIELAAARTRLLAPDALLSRLDHRLPMLTGGPRDLPDRQQTLRRTIAWSYQLLEPSVQRLFAQLAVFMGGWTVEAVEAVCGDAAGQDGAVLTGLEDLAAQNLVYRQATPTGETRLGMLETIREFAGEKLVGSGEQAEMERRHAYYFLQLLECTQAELYGPAQAEWMARLEGEHENLRAALAWALQDHDNDADRVELGLRMAGLLGWLWRGRGYVTEGRQWLAALLARYNRIAGALSEDRIAGLRGARAGALLVAGELASDQGEYDLGHTYLIDSLRIHRELGDRRSLAQALGALGTRLPRSGRDFSESDALLQESLELFRALGDKRGIAAAVLTLVGAAERQGNPALARARVTEGLQLYQELGHKLGIAQTLTLLGEMIRKEHDLAGACATWEEALRLQRELNNPRGIALLLGYLGETAWVQGDFVASRAFHEEGYELSRRLGHRLEIANSISNLGETAFGAGDYVTARMHLIESLPLFTDLHAAYNAAATLTVLAAVEITDASQRPHSDPSGLPEPESSVKRKLAIRGVTLLGAAEVHVGSNGTDLQYVERGIFERAAATARELLGDDVYAAARSAGQAMTIEQAVAYAQDGLVPAGLEVPLLIHSR